MFFFSFNKLMQSIFLFESIKKCFLDFHYKNQLSFKMQFLNSAEYFDLQYSDLYYENQLNLLNAIIKCS